MYELPQQVKNILQILKVAGYASYVVGGSVRDLLMHRSTTDWDFTTNATPEKILELFPDSYYDNAFGTVGVKVRNPMTDEVESIYEITTFRSEISYTDSRHPDEVLWGSTIMEDLSRRDLTINAIAYNGTDWIDPYDGRNDLKNAIIRTVGNPTDRFNEDALRIMRAVRIATQLGFMIEPDTLSAIRSLVPKLSMISWERIREELYKILASKYPADGILLLKNTQILSYILPELDCCFIVDQKSPGRHHIYDVGTHSVEALRNCPSEDPTIRLATLLHDIGKKPTQVIHNSGLITFYNHEVIGARMAKQIGYRLRLSKKQIDLLYTLIRWHQFTVDERQTDAAIRRFIRHTGKENLDAMLALRIGDRLGGGALETSWRLELFKKRLEEVQKQPFGVTDLHIDGFIIMKECDIKPGPIIGKILTQLFTEVEAGTLVNEPEALVQRLKLLKPTIN